MKSLIDFLLRQPITIAVFTMLAVFTGILAITRVPVRMTPEVSSVVVAVVTNWENASSDETESDIVEEQEKVLGDIAGLMSLTSNSQAGQGTRDKHQAAVCSRVRSSCGNTPWPSSTA